MGQVYDKALEFKRKHPGGVVWNLKDHCNVVEKHLNHGEFVTNKRILIGQKRVVWGYFLSSITPDLYNDLFVYQGLIWGKIKIDTVKEEVAISNLPKSGLDEIETSITEMMMEEKQKYGHAEESK